MADAGLNAYRFSLEWARIEPSEGQFDEEGHMNNADDVHTDGVDSTVSEDGNQNASGETTAELTDQEILDRYEQQALQESEKMAEKMGEQIAR